MKVKSFINEGHENSAFSRGRHKINSEVTITRFYYVLQYSYCLMTVLKMFYKNNLFRYWKSKGIENDDRNFGEGY